jgi:hypothetical protein
LEENNIIEDLIICKEQQDGMTTLIVLSIVTGWDMKNYLASEIAQKRFHPIICHYSKNVMCKQLKLHMEGALIYNGSAEKQMLKFRKKLVSKQFSVYMT